MVGMPGFFEIIALALLVLLVVVTVRLVKSGRAWPWVIGAVAAVASVAILALGLYTVGMPQSNTVVLKSVRHYPDGAGSARSTAVSRRASPGVGEGTWLPSSEHEFEADIYPSMESAAIALAERLVPSLEDIVPGGVRFPPTDVDGNVPDHVLAAAHRAFQNAARASDRGRNASAPTFRHPVRLSIKTVDVGHLEATLAGSVRNVTRHARFVEKPWVEDLAAFRTEAENTGRSFLVACSPGLWGTRREAEEQALRAAAAGLQLDLGRRIQRHARRMPDPNWLRGEIESALRGAYSLADGRNTVSLVADQFTQRFHRPYGEVWRAAVLIDKPPEVLEPLAVDLAHRLATQQNAWVRTTLSIAGLVILILVLYLLLNAATRGYYVWGLRGAVVVLVVVGVLFVLAVVG